MNKYTTVSKDPYDGSTVSETERYARSSGRYVGKTVSESGTDPYGNQYAESTKYNSRGKATDSSRTDYGQEEEANKKKVAPPLYSYAQPTSNISIAPGATSEPTTYGIEAGGQGGFLDSLSSGTGTLDKINSINQFNSPVSGGMFSGGVLGGSNENETGLIARAGGGPVKKDEEYIVGENGPEKFVPNRPGMIIPNPSTGDWHENRDKIIANTGSPIPQQPLKLGVHAEMYTQEQADAARKYNDGLRSQSQGKGNFVPDYLTGSKTGSSDAPAQIPQKQQANVDRSGWALSDLAKEKHFAKYGNPWNPSMNTPIQKVNNTPQGEQSKPNVIVNFDDGTITTFGPKGETKVPISKYYNTDGANFKDLPKARQPQQNRQPDLPKTNSMDDIRKRHDTYSQGNPNRAIAQRTEIIQNGRIANQYFTQPGSYSNNGRPDTVQDIRRRLDNPSSYSSFLLNPGHNADKGETPLYSIPVSTYENDLKRMSQLSGYDQGLSESSAKVRHNNSLSDRADAETRYIPSEHESKIQYQKTLADQAIANTAKTNVEIAQIPANSESTRAEQVARANNLNNPKPDNALAIAQMNNATKLSEMYPEQYHDNLAMIQGKKRTAPKTRKEALDALLKSNPNADKATVQKMTDYVNQRYK
jgi:hypothetical protein